MSIVLFCIVLLLKENKGRKNSIKVQRFGFRVQSCFDRGGLASWGQNQILAKSAADFVGLEEE
jgi:hypothetical protein